MNDRRDWATDLGIGVVGLAAAILTFTTLRGLAETVGFRDTVFGVLHQAWLLPVTIDAAGVVAARVWLRGTASPEAVAFARTLTWACIGASIVGNAGQHVMAELGVAPPWWVVVLVTAVPPATLGAAVHLGHLVRRTTNVPVPVPDDEPVSVTAETASDQAGHAVPAVTVTDEEILAWLRDRAAEDRMVPSRKAVIAAWGIGATRADRLRGLVTVPARIRRVK